MRTPRRPIGAGGWFLRAYAAGFGVMFGIGSAVFVGGMFYLVLAGVGTMLLSSDGAIEIDLTGNHAASQPIQSHMASNPYPPPTLPAGASGYHSQPLSSYSMPNQSPPPSAPTPTFDPYQSPGTPDRVPPPTLAEPVASTPHPTASVGSLVPVEYSAEASATFEEPSRPILDTVEDVPVSSEAGVAEVDAATDNEAVADEAEVGTDDSAEVVDVEVAY